MGDNRRIFTTNEKMVLFNEVDGRCPKCGKVLAYKKNNNINKAFEVAHIYPANPLPVEATLLINEERLSEDVNSLDNVIALCSICHKHFDNPRTIEEYRSMVRLKKKLKLDADLKNSYAHFNIESEINEILKELNDELVETELIQLNLDSLKIDQKANETLSYTLKRSIKNDVVDYFDYIRKLFIEMDKITPHKFNILASQVRGFYYRCMQSNPDQDYVFYALVDWLDNKTHSNYSNRVCEIIISYFIQDCEVFS